MADENIAHQEAGPQGIRMRSERNQHKIHCLHKAKMENIGKLRLEVTTPKKSIQILFSSRAIVILLETEAATSPAPVQIRAKTGRSPTMLASI
jgi:hypothetical protein